MNAVAMNAGPRIWMPLCLALLFLAPWALAAPAEINGKQTAYIAQVFQGSHYSQEALDDAHSERMFWLLVNGYDPEHAFFLQSDVDTFAQDKLRLDDEVKGGDDHFPYEVHKRFIERAGQRLAQVQAILKENLDLQADERLETDRKKAPFPKSDAEAAAYLRKRAKFDLVRLKLMGKTEAEAKEAVEKRYRNIELRTKQFNHLDIVSGFINALTNAFDPHSAYMPPEEQENFNIQMSLTLQGIGATLRSEDGYTIVTDIVPGGAAAREGSLQTEDRIVGVGQNSSGPLEDVMNMRLNNVIALIRGPKGTTVRLQVERLVAGKRPKRVDIKIVRDTILLKDGEASGKVIDLPAGDGHGPLKVGVITLPSFYVDFEGYHRNPNHYKSASRDVQAILEKFIQSGIDGVVMDIRNNGGGGLDDAVRLAGLFLPPGPVVMVKYTNGRVQVMGNERSRALYNGPLVVMTNRYSASASEIFAGAIQDYGRGVIVGEKSTFGKGTVQDVRPISEELGALRVTIAKFYRPGASSTQNKGVESDIVLPSLNNHMEVGEAAMDYALPWDAIRRANFRPWGDMTPYLLTLRANSQQRLAKNADFREVSRRVAEYTRDRESQKAITLKELWEEGEAEKAAGNGNGKHGPKGKGKDKAKDIVLDEGQAVLADLVGMSKNQ